MEEKKSLVEEAIIQMKNLEDVIAENAKGILASTMKEEISELVKESLNETKKSETHEDEEEEEDFAMTADDEESEEEEEESEDEGEDEGEEMDITMMDIETEPMMSDIPMDDETIDLTGEDDSTVLSVLKKMKPEDQIIVKKENGFVHLKDEEDDVEYMISMTESDEDEELDEMWQTSTTDEEVEEDMEEGMYSETYEDTDEGMYSETYEDMEEDMDEVVYEITMEEDEEEEEEEESEEEYEEGYSNEDYSHMMESKMTVKPKGMGMGHASKAKYPKTLKHGTTEAKEGMGKKGEHKEGKMTTKPVGKGIGKGPKFTYEEGEHMDSTKGMKGIKKSETKEAARTLGNGKRWGKPGLPKPKAAPRHLNLESEVRSLRDKNEEYRKALNIFREKLNEVAVFNANLAYATRLFTEHSTTKQEKINILRRFDSVDSLKESKALYKTLKEELSSTEGKVVKESIENVIDRNPQSGSAVNLIENKTYENPQFMRMKDLMSKLIK